MLTSVETPAAEAKTFMDLLGYGGETLALGIIMVFFVLATIFLVVLLTQAVLRLRKAKAEIPATPAPAPIIAPSPVPTPAAPAADDRALVAAITAAISAYTATSPSAFRVVSFKKL